MFTRITTPGKGRAGAAILIDRQQRTVRVGGRRGDTSVFIDRRCGEASVFIGRHHWRWRVTARAEAAEEAAEEACQEKRTL